MRIDLGGLVLLAASLLAAEVIAPAQEPTQAPPVFRAGAHIVPLDISVLDKDRKPVTDLKQSDFTVFENGVKQDIRSFFPQKLEPEMPQAGASPTLLRTASPSQMPQRTRRTFLFVLGDGRMVGPGNIIDATLTFIRERLLPQDLVAVMAFNLVTDLTTDHRQVADVIERYRLQHEAILRAIADFYWCAMCNRGEDLPPEVQDEIDAVFRPRDASPDRLQMRSATRLLLQSPELKSDYRFAVPGMAYGLPTDLPWNRRVVYSDVIKLYAGIEYLRAVAGDKHLIWITGSGLTDRKWSVQDDKRLAMTAGSARVALDIYYTSPTGWAVDAAERAANLSGGQYTGVNEAKVLFDWVDQATRFSYLLGYSPTNQKLDNKTRDITVKVNRPDVTVLFRHGYVAEPAVLLSPAEQKRKVVAARLKSAAGFGVETRDIRIRARASFAPGPNRRVFVDATIDASRISFTQAGGRRVASLEIQVFCGDIKEKVLGQVKQTMNLSVEEDTYQRYLANGIPYSARVPINAGGDPTYVKVLVYDFAADLIGAAIVKLR